MRYDDEHQIGDYVDVILNHTPDSKPDNFMTAGKVIKKHYDKEDMPPCAYDLEFTVEFTGDVLPGVETQKRITTRVHNVDEKYCWRRDTNENMNSAGVQIAQQRLPESQAFEFYSYNRKFVLYSTEYYVMSVETEDAYKWHVKDADNENKMVFTYTILKRSGTSQTEKLFKDINESLTYFDGRFEDMVAMVKSDFDKGLLK